MYIVVQIRRSSQAEWGSRMSTGNEEMLDQSFVHCLFTAGLENLYLWKQTQVTDDSKAVSIDSKQIITSFGWLVNVQINPVYKLDPVVQSIVSLTSSLRGHLIKCFTTF